MRCPNCGNENPDGARFCSTCGNALTETMAGSAPSPGEAEDESRMERPPGPTPPGPPEPGPTPEPPTPEPTPEPPSPEPTPHPPTPQPTPPAPTVPMGVAAPVGAAAGTALTAGWGKAVGRAALAFIIVVLLGQVIPWLATASDPEAAPETLDVIKIGGVFFFLFHHAGITFDLPNFSLGQDVAGPFGGAIPVSVTLAMAMMLGTAVAVWLLYRGGRAVAASAGGRPAVRALNGAKVALPYAILALGFSFLINFSIPLPPLPFFEGGQPLDIGPSPIAAFLWPLALGLIAGAWGGLSTAKEEIREGSRGRTVAAIIGGGWRMAWYALGLAFIGYLITAALNPDVPLPFGPEYFRAVAGADTVLDSVLLVLATVLVVPNIATLVLVPAMGGALGFSGSASGLELSCTLLSYTKFPSGGGEPSGEALLDVCASLPIRFETAPFGYFLFLLVPLVATVVAARRAARRADATSTSNGAAIGAASGVVFAAIVFLLMVLAAITFRAAGGAGGFGGSQNVAIGPALISGLLVALAWGVAGGALGGALGAGAGGGESTGVAVPRTEPVPASVSGATSGFERTRPVSGFERPKNSEPPPSESSPSQ
jgi:hypothetical protein